MKALASGSSVRATGLRKLGGDEVVSDTVPLRGRFDLIMESVGDDMLAQRMKMVDPSGTPVMPGTSSGELTTLHPQGAHRAHGPINHVRDAVFGERALHLCFGNYGGQSIQRGLWRDVLVFLDALHLDDLVLEFARRGYHELPVLRPDNALGIGVIDIKDSEVETPDEVARRIEHAVAVLGDERVRSVDPDRGFWMLSRSGGDRKLSALVRGRDLFEGSAGRGMR